MHLQCKTNYSIQDLIDTESNTMAFKVLTVLAPEYLSKVIYKKFCKSSVGSEKYQTDLQLPKKTTTSGQKCFSYRGVKSWNCLPLETKQASSLKGFKAKQE